MESLQAAGTAAVPRGAGRDSGTESRVGHPEVVTLEPVQDEELAYAVAMPLVDEWRQQRIAHLDEGARRVERSRALVRMLELELVLIGDYELALPPATYPWDESRRRDELRRVRFALVSARRELAQALFWRWVRLALTLGRWRM